MAIDERARHRLYERLEAVLGPDEAAILMEHLPPVGWADVATKRDLDALAVATKRDLDALAVATKRDLDAFQEANRGEHQVLAETFRLEHEVLEQRMMAAWRADLLQQTRTMILAMITTMTTAVLAVGGLAFAAARLT